MKTKIGINSKDYLPQRFAHKDPHPELPFEGSNERASLWGFLSVTAFLLVIVLAWL